MSVLVDNLNRVKDRITQAAQRSGRSAGDITLIVVSKTWPVDVIQQVVDAGVVALGENRVQEAESKVGAIVGKVSWHLIGHLQRNKVKTALSLFHFLHSVDSLKIAQEISHKAAADGMMAQVLVQVNTSGETSKFGVAPDAALDLVGRISEMDGIVVNGLMTIGAFVTDLKIVRRNFELLRTLRDQIEDAHLPGVSMAELSMGMTSDFEVAIEEGATMVRVGTAIFGTRAA